MTTTPIARILDQTRRYCPGVLDGTARDELYYTMKEMFQRTNCWIFELPVYVTPASNDYQISTGQNVAVIRLMTLDRPRTQLVSPIEYVPMCPPQYIAVLAQNNIQEAMNPLYRVRREGVLLNPGSCSPILRIELNPQVTETWIATLALNIIDPMDVDGLPVVPEWIVEKYTDDIFNGVVSRLMTQGGKSYSNEKGAAFHGRKFNQSVGKIRQEIRDMFKYGGQRWGFPGGWRTYHPVLY
jgi:hypothetical protein